MQNGRILSRFERYLTVSCDKSGGSGTFAKDCFGYQFAYGPGRVKDFRTCIAVLFFWISAAFCSTTVMAGGPLIAAAASIRPALEEISTRYNEVRGESVRLVFGSSGTLANQIANWCPLCTVSIRKYGLCAVAGGPWINSGVTGDLCGGCAGAI